jgi:hypothetical protein
MARHPLRRRSPHPQERRQRRRRHAEDQRIPGHDSRHRRQRRPEHPAPQRRRVRNRPRTRPGHPAVARHRSRRTQPALGLTPDYPRLDGHPPQRRTAQDHRRRHRPQQRQHPTAPAADGQRPRPSASRSRSPSRASRRRSQRPRPDDRRIARACAISEASVRRSRRPPASPAPLDTRVGIDGKTYPVSKVAHDAARDLLASCPGQSDRAIARATGVSPTTVGRLRRDARTQRPRLRSHRLRPWRAALRWLRSILGLSSPNDQRATSPANPAARGS